MSAGIAIWLLVPIFVEQEPSTAEGGVLILMEDVDSRMSVEIDATIWESGFDDISVLRLKLQPTSELKPGTRWFVVASGQYSPPLDAPLGAFCSSGNWAVREEGTVQCPGDRGLGAASSVEYRRGRELGSPTPDGVQGVVDLSGYDSATVMMVSGVFDPRDGLSEWTVDIPIRDIRLGRSPTEQRGQLAPIGRWDFEWGTSGIPLQPQPEHVIDRPAPFVDSLTGKELVQVGSSESVLDASDLLGSSRLLWTRPDAVTDDELIWRSASGGFGALEFATVSLTGQGTVAARGFLGGTAVSISVACVLLLLEKWLERRPT